LAAARERDQPEKSGVRRRVLDLITLVFEAAIVLAMIPILAAFIRALRRAIDEMRP
jgi:hypothetical protein